MRSKIVYEKFNLGRIIGRANHPVYGVPCYLLSKGNVGFERDATDEVVDKTGIITSLIDRLEIIGEEIQKEDCPTLMAVFNQLTK